MEPVAAQELGARSSGSGNNFGGMRNERRSGELSKLEGLKAVCEGQKEPDTTFNDGARTGDFQPSSTDLDGDDDWWTDSPTPRHGNGKGTVCSSHLVIILARP